MQSSQLDPITNKMDSSLSEAPRGVSVSSSDPSVHQYLVPNRQMELMESISGGSLTQSGMLSRMQRGQVDVKTGNFGRQHFQIPDNQFGGTGNMVRTAEGMLSLPVKRKASNEPLNSLAQQSPLHNKRVAPMEHRPWLQPASGIAKRPHLQIPNNSPAPAPMYSPAGTKRKVQQMESHPTKVGHQRSNSSKGQTAPPTPTSKIQNEPTGSVRSKMRESLTAALALVSQQEDKSSNDEKSSPTEAEKFSTPKQENSLSSGPAIGHVSDDSRKIFSEKLDSVGLEDNVGKMLDKSSLCVNVSDLDALRYDGRVFQPNNVLSYEDISFGDNFFIKDDLLQENGLSWVLEADLGVADKKEILTDELQKIDVGIGNQNQVAKPVQTPESLALKIEEELFKLFSGVNKKYKEKGRSLLFNLKDRNNPELRERVMSGEITPERLCSMTAEELASKELSEWRMAKAEEFAQMVVLPDTEVDIRRLVKKTHKGEFQVEVEEYDNNASADVSSGASTFSQSQSLRNNNESEDGSPDEPEAVKDEQNISGQKNAASNKDNYTFTIASNEGSDLMQGLMVDDGLKDTELLPPIVSLDEFMESLDTEPPFDILAEGAGKLSPVLEKGESEPNSRLKTAAHPPKGATDVSTEKNNEESHTKADIGSSSIGHVDLQPSPTKLDVDSNDNQAGLRTSDRNDVAKSNDSNNAKSETESPASAVKLEHLWDGILQYNISTMTSVVGTYISGERTSAKDWPGILEIKGRVRLDAFEKFLQELPLSRSRAVMVYFVYFCCTENNIHLKSTPGDKNEQKRKMKHQSFFKVFFNVFRSNLLAITMLGMMIGFLLLRRMFWAIISHLDDCKGKKIAISIGSRRKYNASYRIVFSGNLLLCDVKTPFGQIWKTSHTLNLSWNNISIPFVQWHMFSENCEFNSNSLSNLGILKMLVNQNYQDYGKHYKFNPIESLKWTALLFNVSLNLFSFLFQKQMNMGGYI